MPNAPKTPSRNVRVPDELWAAAKTKAAAQGTTVTAVVTAALSRYVDDIGRCSVCGAPVMTSDGHRHDKRWRILCAQGHPTTALPTGGRSCPAGHRVA